MRVASSTKQRRRVAFRIREAGAADARVIADLERRFFAELAFSPEQVNYYRRKRDAMVLLSEADEGRVVGYIVGAVDRRFRGGALAILALGVRPRWRRSGIARRLCRRLCRWAEPWGVSLLVLQVEKRNRPAIALYRSLGFAAGSQLDDYYGPGRPGLVMLRARGKRAEV